jgi:hypothetical protein
MCDQEIARLNERFKRVLDYFAFVRVDSGLK